MTREVSAQVVIDMPREQAWARLRDISLAHNYVPGIVRIEIVSARTEGVGASRYVWRNARSYLQETVVEWWEGEGFLIRLHKGDKPAPPFRNASLIFGSSRGRALVSAVTTISPRMSSGSAAGTSGSGAARAEEPAQVRAAIAASVRMVRVVSRTCSPRIRR